jgi:hypothetical protein
MVPLEVAKLWTVTETEEWAEKNFSHAVAQSFKGSNTAKQSVDRFTYRACM